MLENSTRISLIMTMLLKIYIKKIMNRKLMLKEKLNIVLIRQLELEYHSLVMIRWFN
jgi:hypothetical protein